MKHYIINRERNLAITRCDHSFKAKKVFRIVQAMLEAADINDPEKMPFDYESAENVARQLNTDAFAFLTERKWRDYYVAHRDDCGHAEIVTSGWEVQSVSHTECATEQAQPETPATTNAPEEERAKEQAEAILNDFVRDLREGVMEAAVLWANQAIMLKKSAHFADAHVRASTMFFIAGYCKSYHAMIMEAADNAKCERSEG